MGNSLIDAIKNIYSSLEEKWYKFLDSIEPRFHVYNVIDKIDAVLPSFALLLSILFVVAFLLIGGITMLALQPQPITASIKILGSDLSVIEGVGVTIKTDSGLFQEVTNEEGKITLTLSQNDITVEILKDGYENYSGQFEVAEGDEIVIKLVETTPEMQQKYLTIVDNEGEAVQQEIQIQFSCSTGKDPPQQVTKSSGSEFAMQVAEDCGTVTAIATSSGYKDGRKDLAAFRTTITLFKEEQELGKIQVYVKDKGDSSPLAGIKLLLYNTQNVHINTGVSDESGTEEFGIRAGKYFVKAIDEATGSYSSESSQVVDVGLDATETVTPVASSK